MTTPASCPGGSDPPEPGVPEDVPDVDVDRLITLHAHADVVDRRARLLEYVWKGEGLPVRLPLVEHGVAEPDLAGLRHGRLDRLVTRLSYQVVATSYLIWPATAPNGRLALYVTGHGRPHAPPYDVPLRATAQALLDRGFVVGVVDLPFLGWNHGPIAAPDAAETLIWPEPRRVHELLATYETPQFSALTFFLDPLVLLLNHADRVLAPDAVAVIGFSGGGWATTVLAAIDPRVSYSCQVAGSWPFYLRGLPASKPNHGDWEQRRDALPDFYAIAGYLDLYVMGATGQGRRQRQIINTYDPVCFPGTYHRSYAPVVTERVRNLGAGSWQILEDDTHTEHTVSAYALGAVLGDLERPDDPDDSSSCEGVG